MRLQRKHSLLEEKVKRIPQSQNDVVKKDLVLVDASDNIHHDVRLHLVQNDPVVVEDDIAGLLCRLLQETLLKGLLRLDIGVGVCLAYRGSIPSVMELQSSTLEGEASAYRPFVCLGGVRCSTWRINGIRPQC